MGNLKDKVETVIRQGLPGATTDLEVVPRSEKLSGYVIWDEFTGELQRERQRTLWNVLRQSLSEEEQRGLSAVLTVTPAEAESLRRDGIEIG